MIGLEDDTAKVIRAYNENYHRRYQREPLPLTLADKTTLMDMVRALGKQRVEALIEAYFIQDGGEKKWYVQRGHDVATLRKDQAAIWASQSKQSGQYFEVGKTISGESVVSTDKHSLKDTEFYAKPRPVSLGD